MKKDKREAILGMAESLAEQIHGVPFDMLNETLKLKLVQMAEQQWEEANQASFEFHQEDGCRRRGDESQTASVKKS
jgi:hypothetical protein